MQTFINENFSTTFLILFRMIKLSNVNEPLRVLLKNKNIIGKAYLNLSGKVTEKP